MELKPLEKVEHKFSLEIEFKSEAKNGILMFGQEQEHGMGDFISLAIVDG